jgi:hypothetical protein
MALQYKSLQSQTKLRVLHEGYFKGLLALE